MILDPDGSEVDWLVGYGPPPEKYQEKLDKAQRGVDTFKSLSARYPEEPTSVEVMLKLALKHDSRNRLEKAEELYNRILVLDPGGNKGTTDFINEKVSCTQYAEFNLGYHALRNKTDTSPLKAFVKKYPDSVIVKEAYDRLSTFYYHHVAPRAEAEVFYQEYAGRFPSDPAALNSWVMRILQDKAPVNKGIELAEKAIALSKASPDPEITINLAHLYLLKGDQLKAVAAAEKAAITAEDRLLLSIAEVFLEAGREDQALAIYGPAFVRKNYKTVTGLPLYVNFWLHKDKNLESALEAGKRTVELMPNNWLTWYWISQIYIGSAEKAHYFP
ncbi:MAG: hypothetical protein NTV82_01415 [Candidatus Aminicenantes bacterium]|nr:hypothetical protein [Candidatus Aminicenantes bacterium]